MKKIKSALFMVALCATLAMLTSCGNNKKTKYTYAPLWDNTISEKDTTGIVGHIFVTAFENVFEKDDVADDRKSLIGSTLESKMYLYFSENGYIVLGKNITFNSNSDDEIVKKISEEILEEYKTDKEFEAELKKIYDTDKAFNKKNAKRTLNENEWKKEMKALELSDAWEWETDENHNFYSINTKNNTIEYVANGKKETIYFKIEKDVPVIELEIGNDKNLIFTIYK